MKSDEAFKKGFNLFLDKDSILNLVFLKRESIPRNSLRKTELIEKAVLNLFKENSQKQFNGLIDLSKLEGGISYLSGKVRKSYSRLMSQERIKKIAIISPSLFYKIAVDFIIKAAGKRETVKWFANKENALKWLKKEDALP